MLKNIDMILDIRSMMKSRRHFTYPSKICRENGVVRKGYCRDMMTLFEVDSAMNRNITPTYCRKRSVSLNTTKDKYIASEKKESKYSSK